MLRLPRHSSFLPMRAAAAVAIAAAAVATAAVAAPTLERPATPESAMHPASDGGDCGWFAIAASSRNYSGVQRVANRVGGWVVNSNDVPEFTPNLFVAVVGPDTKGFARAARNRMRQSGYGDAYIKYGCRY